MIPGLDSAAEPNTAQIAAAQAAGIRLWSGYISTAPYDGFSHYGLWHPWSQATFERCKALGSTPIAYASGNDSPTALAAQAASWGVRLCLDVESGIRGDGPWVQPWLAASGAGLYGNAPVHVNRVAAFHILAAYPMSGDPAGASWSSSGRPSGPCGWQWAGSHGQFGITVDSTWFDDWFAGLHGPSSDSLDDMFSDTDRAYLTDIGARVADLVGQTGTRATPVTPTVPDLMNAIKAGGGGSQTSDDTLTLNEINAKLDRLIAELHTP